MKDSSKNMKVDLNAVINRLIHAIYPNTAIIDNPLKSFYDNNKPSAITKIAREVFVYGDTLNVDQADLDIIREAAIELDKTGVLSELRNRQLA